MKAFILNPMVLAGIRAGYNRPLDRHDFPHGTIPDRVGLDVPGVGELRRFGNLSMIAGSQGTAAQMFDFGTTQLHPLGSIAIARDGRMFRYGKADAAAALVTGNVIQGPPIVANHTAQTPAAAAIGATSVTITTLGATAAAANLYAEGWISTSVAPDLGHMYRISGHAANAGSAALILNLDPDDPIQVAWTTSTRVDLTSNKYMNLIQFPVTTATGMVAGIAVSPIALSNYGWVQTHGYANVLVVGTPALGAYVMTPSTTAGTGVIITTTNLVVAQLIGRMVQVGAAGETNIVDLDID